MENSRSLADRVDSNPTGWRPDPGDKIVGTIVDIDERESNYGSGVYPVVVVADDDGNEVAVHAFHTVLKKEIARQRPTVGDQIAIKYHGIREGQNYEFYRVVVVHSDPVAKAEPDWDAIERDAQAELSDSTGEELF
jgi:hypothetical protein